MTEATHTKSTVRELTLSEQGRFARTLDAWLRPDAQLSASDDCPLLLGPRAQALRLVAECNGRIGAHVALHIHRLRTPHGLLRVGVIGGVATAPDLRGQGLASQVLARMQQEARARSIDVLVLWATETGLYERAGFVRAGQEWLALAPMTALPRGSGSVRPATERDIGALMRLHDAQPTGTLRSLAQWEELLSIPAMTVLVHSRGGISGTPDAYVVCGKGHDLQGCIHEWSGAPEALLMLAHTCCTVEHREDIVIMGAPWQSAAHEALTQRGVNVVWGALGMMQALDPAGLLMRYGASPQAGETPALHANATDADLPIEVQLFGLNEHSGACPVYLQGLDSM